MTEPMVKFAGIDGCKAGWFYVGIDGEGDFHFSLKSTFSQTINALKSAQLILIDMPIGLPTAAQRQRYCDVAARKAISPRGSSVFPAPARSALLQTDYEAACEENRRILGKKLSVQSYPKAQACFEECKGAYLRNQVAGDDILDAMAGAVTAMYAPNLGTMPPNPVFDDQGLPMEIVYARVTPEPSISRGLYYDQLEAAAAEILGKIIFALTRFEFNLALAIRLIEVHPREEQFELWKDKLNLKGKLERLEKYLTERFSPETDVAIQFQSWYRNIELVRKKRNAFVHGRWWVEHGVQQIINVSDDYPGTGEKGLNRFSVGELQRELDDIDRLSLEFSRLRRDMQI